MDIAAGFSPNPEPRRRSTETRTRLLWTFDPDAHDFLSFQSLTSIFPFYSTFCWILVFSPATPVPLTGHTRCTSGVIVISG